MRKKKKKNLDQRKLSEKSYHILLDLAVGDRDADRGLSWNNIQMLQVGYATQHVSE